jgi:putative ABC transport system permease protein
MRTILFLGATALSHLRRTKWRSLLTISSIIIGIAAVIATLGIGRGVQEKILDRINSFGVNALYLHAGTMGQAATSQTKKQHKTIALTGHDADFLRNHPLIEGRIASTIHARKQQITFQNKTVSADLTGIEPGYLSMTKMKLTQGRDFLPHELLHRAPVVVIGSRVAQELFRARSALNETVVINSRPFRVIGVLDEAENTSSFHDRNLAAYLPLSVAHRHFTTLPEGRVHSILISLPSESQSSDAERTVRRIMRARHKLQPEQADDFTIWNQSSMATAAQASAQMLNLLLLIIASLSLLVGGIGVSNIMLVSVSERTKEIGIRMSLGASPRIILLQFLIESMMLCFFGGVLGVALGTTLPKAIAGLLGWKVIITWQSIVVSVGITIMIGLLFGYLPARRAARLAIVDALNDQ